MDERARLLRCAIYTRKSSEEGLEQPFNSLDAQREAGAAYIQSQQHEGWQHIDAQYDDGGYSGGTMERPALLRLLADIDDNKIDVVVVYKVDRLTRSMADFAKIIERFDARGISFVSITQQFSTTTSMGRLTLNILLSFAQFEREVTGERIRDKIAASKKKGMWMGGRVPVGYDVKDRKLISNEPEAAIVNQIYQRYLALGSVNKLKRELDAKGIRSKVRVSKTGRKSGDLPYSRGTLYNLLQNQIYLGEIPHRNLAFPGEHAAIVSRELWDQVQARLKANHQARRIGTNRRAPSLLVGLLYDDSGNRLTPSHAVKDGKRYRYYVSQAIIQQRQGDPGAPTRIPAHDIEELVGRRICAFLIAAREVIAVTVDSSDSADLKRDVVAAAKRRASAWPNVSTSEKRALLQSIVTRITLSEMHADIDIDRQSLREMLLSPDAETLHQRSAQGTRPEKDLVRLTVDARLRRSGGVVRLIVPSAYGSQHEARPNPVLIKAIARAHQWHEQLLSELTTQYFIAKAYGVSNQYVSRVLRGAFLAPDIVDAILTGHQPIELTLDKMLANVPLDWDQQRQILGFNNREAT